MPLVLYRKYRPQNFFEIIGQEPIVMTLTNQIRQGRAGHAYLFSGPRGLGKTSLARILAKAVNCQNRKDPEFEPCNQCSSCQEIIQGRSLDLVEIDAASNRGINEIRELKERVRFAPVRDRYKVFIIDECQMLTPEAFNALLKTLEEPPRYVIFILATTEIHKVPRTIISRCQRFDFNKVGFDQIAERLKKITEKEKIKIEDEVLKTIAARSGGCVRDAESLLSQVLSLDEKEITAAQAEIVLPSSQSNLIIEFVELIFKKDDQKAVSFLNQIVEEGIDLEQFTKDLIEFLRKILLTKIQVDEKKIFWQVDGLSKNKIQKLAQEIEIKKLVEIIEEFIQTQLSLADAEIPQLPLELAVIRLVNNNGK